MFSLPFLPLDHAAAGVGFGVVPDFPTPVTVGQTGLPGTLTVTNVSDGTQAVGNVTLNQITLAPSCSNFAPGCAGGTADPAAFTLSATGTGTGDAANPNACTGRTFNLVVTNPATGEREFQPVGGPVVLGPPSLANDLDVCQVAFTFNVNKVPNHDSFPAVPGVQTNQIGFAIGTHQDGTVGTGSGSDVTTVLQAAPTITTQATPTAQLGQPISDTASVTGPANSPAPTGTVTFTAFGPNDPTCAGPPAFTSANRPLSGGPPTATATSASFTPTQPGTYRWIAAYSGDANYTPVTTACNDPNETSVVTQAAPTITTQATPTINLGQTATDTASVTGLPNGPAPTGTVTFTVFGPDNPSCTGLPVFTSAGRPLSGGPPTATATSDPFTPPAAGTYRWIASYSGDANYAPVTTACNDPNEATVVNAIAPTIVTQATPTAPLGSPISDTASVTGPAGAPAPTGTVDFSLFGPDNPTCTGPPVFISVNRPLSGGPPTATATSDPFAPLAVGTYRWIASYSGDANYTPVTTACNDPNESSVVGQAAPTVVTQATPTAPLGSPISDTATVTGPAGAPAPTGTVTFTLFGPDNPTCTGPPVFTSANRPLSGGPPSATATSDPFTPPAVGTYRWIASYSGDANYTALTTACNDPNESSVVGQAAPTVVTQATPTAPLGSPISDTATVSGPAGVPAPTGTVTFILFGPDNPTCTGPPVFTSANRPLSGGPPPTATSAPFTPTAVGTYRWIAAYSGDANYTPVTTACNDPNESSLVTQVAPTIVTQATPSATLGQPISDTATVTGPAAAPAPTGTVTFTAFGPNDPACAGPAVFTSANRPLSGGPPSATANSAPFTPTAVGTYRWIASYSGDANYPAVTTACNDPNETSVVGQAVATIATQATPTAPLGSPISDVATVTGAAGAPAPTGTVTFTLFDNPTCAGTPVFTSANRPLSGGPPPTATSEPFIPQAAGSYYWIASYSGDANYAPATSPCAAPGEISVVNPVAPTVTTNATPTVTIGGPINDTATVTGAAGAPAPTGTVTFTVFGPNDVNCTGAPAFTSPNRPLSGGPPPTATSQPFTPATAGVYRWIAAYSGDANYTAVTTACNDPNESSVVAPAGLSLTTQTTPSVALGQPVTDTATLSGGFNPTGTITFRLFGPDDADCTGTPVFTDTVPVSNGNGTYISGPFIPTAPGTYRWTAEYSGDVNNAVVETACNDPNETVQVRPLPTIAVTKTPDPTSRPEPGGTFTFTVVVTNTSANPLTLTALTDDIYGNLSGRGTCATGATLAANGGTYTCSFPGDFFGNAGATQTDTVTATGTDPFGQTATATARATVTITNVLPAITVTKTANPTSRPEPGGTFTFTVVVTNPSPEPVSLVSLVDDVYGDLNGKGTCDVTPPPLLAANGGTYSCSFEGTFIGDAGQSQTDTVTATGRDDEGNQVTARDDATVTITGVPPAISVTKTADPTSRPAPGGSFTFTVVVTNTSTENVTITSLTDNVYGDLNGKGTCATGAVLQPGQSYTCSFEGSFTGAGGATQTDTVTAIAVDNEGDSATARADATVRLEVVPSQPLPRTGGGVSGPLRSAVTLLALGLLMVAVAARRLPGPLALAGVPIRRRPWPPEPPSAPRPVERGPRPSPGSAGAALASGMGVGAGRPSGPVAPSRSPVHGAGLGRSGPFRAP